MTLDEAANLETRGRYADYLRGALEELSRAAIEGRPGDEALWSVHAARACRRIGRNDDGFLHAARAAELARSVDDRALARHALAIGLRAARRHDESLAALRKAVDSLPSEGRDLLRAEILLEIAETAFEAGAVPEARAALTGAGALLQGLRDSRLFAWSLFLRGQMEEAGPADLQYAAAYEIAKSVGCPELQWQILWRLSERAETAGRTQMRDDLTWCAVDLLAELAGTLATEDASAFWRQGPRRVFLDQAQRRYGPQFLRKVMLGGGSPPDPSEILRKELGFDRASVAAYLNAAQSP